MYKMMWMISVLERLSESVCVKESDSLWYEAIAQSGGPSADVTLLPS